MTEGRTRTPQRGPGRTPGPGKGTRTADRLLLACGQGPTSPGVFASTRGTAVTRGGVGAATRGRLAAPLALTTERGPVPSRAGTGEGSDARLSPGDTPRLRPPEAESAVICHGSHRKRFREVRGASLSRARHPRGNQPEKRAARVQQLRPRHGARGPLKWTEHTGFHGGSGGAAWGGRRVPRNDTGEAARASAEGLRARASVRRRVGEGEAKARVSQASWMEGDAAAAITPRTAGVCTPHMKGGSLQPPPCHPAFRAQEGSGGGSDPDMENTWRTAFLDGRARRGHATQRTHTWGRDEGVCGPRQVSLSGGQSHRPRGLWGLGGRPLPGETM